ncbi:DEAD/DEAH box helicase [Agromyces sp. MMS24-JH15]|uniref:DEAD/DEAH box helicase n=1 Tax=Agromyces sp. MMS24-JH15 TaxID=3243765 RepID=UPI003747C5BA
MTSVDSQVEVEAPAEPAAITFADLGLDGAVLKALRDVGYETPSPIQAATIPTLLSGRDVVGLAQTGTGKTAAFAVPILQRLDVSQKTPQALVLAPTRELALQVCEAFEKYASRLKDVHILPVYGGQAYGVQLSALRRGVHIVVGTPGRIMDHLDRGTLDLSELKYLVLDEADEMLKMGFAEDVESILADTPDDKQVALFSATMPAAIRRISQQYLTDPEEITVKAKTQTSANITQRYLVVSFAQKIDALTRILEVENFEGMIVFVRTKNVTEEVAEKLRARGYSAAAINGDLSQQQRERTVNQLKSGKLDILVATDVAARGLDVDRISHVVNFDIPTDSEPYVHRIGRTGRAGRTGDAISFVTPRERGLLARIEKATRQPMIQMQLPTAEDVNVTRLARFDDRITEALSQASRIDAFRDIIAHYVRHHDVPEADVAAALAVVAQGDSPLLLDPNAEPKRGRFEDRGDRPDRSDRFDRDDRRGRGRDGDERGDRGDRRERRRTGGALAPYRIEVGRRQRVEPRQIVGALANEGGLSRDDFGHIDIRQDFSIVELPADLADDVLDRLSTTKISGRPIELRPDAGGRGARSGGDDRRGYGQGARRSDRPRYDGQGRGNRQGDRSSRSREW